MWAVLFKPVVSTRRLFSRAYLDETRKTSYQRHENPKNSYRLVPWITEMRAEPKCRSGQGQDREEQRRNEATRASGRFVFPIGGAEIASWVWVTAMRTLFCSRRDVPAAMGTRCHEQPPAELPSTRPVDLDHTDERFG